MKPKKRKKNQIITRDDEIVESMFEPPLDTIIEEDSENPENNPEAPEVPEIPDIPENNPENPENNPENPDNRKKRRNPFTDSEDSNSDTDGEFDESCEEQTYEQIEYSDMEVEENMIEE